MSRWIVLLVLESCSHEEFDPRKKLDSLMHLAELCVEVIQQNEEYHAEVRLSVSLFSARAVLAQYTLCLKKQDTKLLPITSPNVNRFSKFFHW